LLGHDAGAGAGAELLLLTLNGSQRALGSGGGEHRRAHGCRVLLLASAGLRL
jgi:hypothetical protein